MFSSWNLKKTSRKIWLWRNYRIQFVKKITNCNNEHWTSFISDKCANYFIIQIHIPGQLKICLLKLLATTWPQWLGSFTAIYCRQNICSYFIFLYLLLYSLQLFLYVNNYFLNVYVNGFLVFLPTALLNGFHCLNKYY